MFASIRRIILFVMASFLFVVVIGLLAWRSMRQFLVSSSVEAPAPAPIASIALGGRPSSLTWSADGRYLAAGTWGTAPAEMRASEVYVVDVASASVTVTLRANSWVEGVAFSPDGKWLAVAMRQSIPAGPAPAELVVLDVPGFKPRFTARAGGPENGFIDLAWAADSLALLAIDCPEVPGEKAEVRRWAVPAFTEQRTIHLPPTTPGRALAVAPDNSTLAVAEQGSASGALRVRLFDLSSGTEQRSFIAGENFRPPRLGFTSDGKALGVFDGFTLSWWDPATGGPAHGPARFANLPASLADGRSTSSVAADGSRQARGYEIHRGLGDLGWDNRDKEFGAFIELAEREPASKQTWRVSQSNTAPVVAFSPDGTRLAGAIAQSADASILIWSVAK